MGKKPKIIKDFNKIDKETQRQILKAYPYGFTKYLILFRNRNGKLNYGLPFETNDMVYLIRMPQMQSEEYLETPILDDEVLIQNPESF